MIAADSISAYSGWIPEKSDGGESIVDLVDSTDVCSKIFWCIRMACIINRKLMLMIKPNI